MAITVKQLQEHLSSSEGQEELAELANQANEASKKMLAHFAEQIQESHKTSFSNLFGQKASLNEYFKGCFAELMRQSSGMSERYAGPAYIPPPLYLEQSPPKIVYIYIYDLPGLN